MKKRIIILAAALGILFLAICMITVFTVFHHDERLHRAVITLGGNVIRTVDLDTAPDEEFRVDGDNGYNIVCIKNGEIYVSDASCPDKICVNHGSLRSEYLPIICMPNRLVIELR